MSQIPTVIISYESKMMAGYGLTGKLSKLKHYQTDVGWLSLPEMSRRTGVNKFSIKTRMITLQPGDKEIFSHKHRLSTGNPTQEWLKMGSKPRDRNLRRIAEHGIWEARV